jgi:penicillin-insensitive murein endopeptidase
MIEGRHVDHRTWRGPQTRLLRLAARDPAVERIFVNPAIKAHLCRTVRGSRAWLHKIRPWWGHQRHFHVRLVCPHGDAACISQAPIPPGDGCDASLAWWFTPAASEPTPPEHKGRPVLPAACRSVLAGRAVVVRR